MQLIVAPVVRFLVTLALAAAATLVLTHLAPDDTGLGTGLLVFALAAVVTLVWSFLDARRGRGVLGVVFAWLAVGLLLGVVGAFNAQGFAWPPDRSVLTSDLRGLPPFMAMLVGVPAVVGAALGALTGRLTSSAGTSRMRR